MQMSHPHAPSFAPSINKKLPGLASFVHGQTADDCDDKKIAIFKNGKHSCVEWDSVEARDYLLSALNTNTKPSCTNIIAPKQAQSNCWFNSFFIAFFISDKGRAFTRYLRQTMITGIRLDGSKIDEKLRWPFFILNKCIEVSLSSANKKAALIYLMDTNIIIKQIYENLPKALRSRRSLGLNIGPGKAYNPIDYYQGLVEYLDSESGESRGPTLSAHFGPGASTQLKMEKIHITPYSCRDATQSAPMSIGTIIQDRVDQMAADREAVGLPVRQIPDIFTVNLHEGCEYVAKPLQLAITSSTQASDAKYVLDSVIIRDVSQRHWSTCMTCGGKEFVFDGRSYSSLQKFKWKKLLSKNIEWFFNIEVDKNKTDLYFNFSHSYLVLLYYRV